MTCVSGGGGGGLRVRAGVGGRVCMHVDVCVDRRVVMCGSTVCEVAFVVHM